MDQSERILSLKLLNTRDRPFISYIRNNEEIIAMMDTGALTPVWCMGVDKFTRSYPDAIKKNKKCNISGFGHDPIIGEVFVIPEFILGKDTVEYRITDLQVAVCNHPKIGCDFVLSDTMFSHADTLFFRRGVKHVDIVFDKDQYHCTARYENDRFTVVTWAQDED